MKVVDLKFGALAPKINEQLTAQGYYDPKASKHQKISDAIIMLSVHGYISDSQIRKMEIKLFNSICREIKPLGVSTNAD